MSTLLISDLFYSKELIKGTVSNDEPPKLDFSKI